MIMRKIRQFLLTTVVLMGSALTAWAQTTFENEAGTLKFTVTDPVNRYVSVAKGTTKPTGALEIPAKVTYPQVGGKEYTVTSIAASAFSSCSGLTSVTFAEGSQLTSIGNDAFINCSQLASIDIPAGVKSIGQTAFYSCSKLTTITIPESVTNIGETVFCDCSLLTDINVNGNNTLYASENGVLFNKTKTTLICCPAGKTESYSIPEGVTNIGYEAFRGCSNITSIAIPASVTNIGGYAFNRCSKLSTIAIPASVTSIGYSAFYYCSGLTSVTFAEGSQLTSIDSYTFAYCSKLASITIPASVTSIGDEAFYYCSGLTSVTFAEGSQLTSIGNYAFYSSALTSITIPASVKSIGENVFYNCIKLTEISVNGNNTEFASENGVLFNKAKTTLLFCPVGKTGAYSIPGGVTTIADNAFCNCNKLTSISLSESVTNIGYNAFYGCSMTYNTFDNAKYLGTNENQYQILMIATATNITSCEINSNCKAIAGGAFSYCSNLTSISIHEGITSIGSRAFESCSGLTSITIPENVTSIGDEAFRGCNSLATVTINNNLDYSNAYLCFQKDDFYYKVLDNNSVSIASCSNSNSTDPLTIPETVTAGNTFNVTAIGSNSFSSCRATSLTIPASVTSIGTQAFFGSSLAEIILAEGNTAYIMEDHVLYNIDKTTLVYCCPNGMSGSFVIPETVKKIESGAFMGTHLTTLTIPEGVTGISSAFYTFSCKLMILPAMVTDIGDNSFNYMAGVSIVAVLYPGNDPKAPWGAPYLNPIIDGDFVYADEAKTNLIAYIGADSDVTIPNSVMCIKDNAFSGCKSLTSVTIPNSVISIGNGAFSESALTSVTIPNSVTSIGERAFAYTSSLESVTIPKSVESIGNYAFYYCDSLKAVTLPNSVTSIGGNAFSCCQKLASVAISESVKSIGNYAFDGSNNVTLYCEIAETEKPAGWLSNWNKTSSTYCPVEWGCKVVRVDVEGDSEIGNVTTGGENYAVKGTDGSMWYLAATTNGTDTLTATPAAHFVKWNDNNTDNPRIVNVTSSQTFTATFSAHADSIVFENVVPATCTEAGSYDSVVYCSICKIELYRETKTVAATGHKADSVAFENIVEATCTAAGSKDSVVYCSVCHVELSRTKVVIPATGHTVVVDAAVAATATTDGLTEGSHCSVCDETIVAQKVVPATGEQGGNGNQGGNENQGGENTNPATAIADDAAASVSIYATGNTIVVENATDDILVYNAMGALICSDAIHRIRAEITISTSGVYIVKTGNTAKRVMVY